MQTDTSGSHVYIALVLAALAAMLSAERSGTLHMDARALLTSAMSEIQADAGVIGDGSELATSP